MATSYKLGEAPWEKAPSFKAGEAPWEVQKEPEKKPGYFQRVGGAFGQAARDITSGIKEGAAQYQSGVTEGTLGGQVRAATGLARSGLRTAGGVAGAAFAPVLEAPGIKQATEFAVDKATEIPGVEKVIKKAFDFAAENPTAAGDLKNIVDIVTLGYAPKVAGGISREARAVGADIAQGARIALTPAEDAVQKNIVELFQKSIKPTAKKTMSQANRYEDNVVSALKTIKANVDNLNIEDDLGEIVTGRTPQTLQELSQSLGQTKDVVFKQYDDLARQAGTGGATINPKTIADEVSLVAQNKALQVTNPELVKYAEGWADRLNSLGEVDTLTAQEIIKNLNNSLNAFYKNPTFDAATRASIDAGIVNNFRKSLDDAIENATGQQYQSLKNQYGALKAIENDVVRAAMRDARKNTKGLLDYTDMFTSGQMLFGIMSLNPAMFTKGAVERGFKEYIKFLNDPNRAVSNMFDMLDTTGVAPFTPQSSTFNFLQGAKTGSGIEDATKKKVTTELPTKTVPQQALRATDDIAQEARKYKSVEEFVKAQTKEWSSNWVLNSGKATAPPAEIITELSKFKPNKPITLYRGIKSDSPENFRAGIQAWTKDKSVAERFAEGLKMKGGQPGRVVSKVFNPDEIITDISKIPDEYASDLVPKDFRTEGEVLIKTADFKPKPQLTDIWEKANKGR